MDVLQMLSSILYLGFVDLTITFYMFVVIYDFFKSIYLF